MLTSQPFLVCTARNVSLNKSINITLRLKSSNNSKPWSKIFQMRIYPYFKLETAPENSGPESIMFTLSAVLCFFKDAIYVKKSVWKLCSKEGKKSNHTNLWYIFSVVIRTFSSSGIRQQSRLTRHFLQWALWSRCAACTQAVFPLLQSPFIPTARTGFWEVRVGDVYSEGARRSRRRCLLLRLLQWGHCSLCQTGHFRNITKIFGDSCGCVMAHIFVPASYKYIYIFLNCNKTFPWI